MHESSIARLLALTLLLGAACPAFAQAPYPVKPVRFIVGFPPGGTNDIVARIVAPKLSENLGQQVVVENRGGANTAIASEMFVRMAPDGYTIMMNAPDIPTVAESGVPGYEVTTFYGVSAPAKTPRAIIDRLHAEFARALNSPEVRERLQGLGADPVGNTPEQYTAFMRNEIAKWDKVIKAAGIKGE